MPGALIGSFLTSFFLSEQLEIFLALLLISLSFSILARRKVYGSRKVMRSDRRFLWKRVIMDSKGEKFEYEINIMMPLPLGLLAGTASGFLELVEGQLLFLYYII